VMAIAERSTESRTLTIQVPEDLAAVLAPLDGALVADSCEIRSLLGDAIYRVHEDLGSISEVDHLPIDELRELARRLDMIIAAAERLED